MFTSTPKNVMESYRACHRPVYVLRCVFAIVLVILSVIVRTPALAASGVAYFVIAELFVRRQLKPYLVGPQTITINMNESEYRTESADRSTSRSWTTFTSVHQVGAFWVLRASMTAAMAFPTTALDRTQTATFEDLMRRKGLLA